MRKIPLQNFWAKFGSKMSQAMQTFSDMTLIHITDDSCLEGKNYEQERKAQMVQLSNIHGNLRRPPQCLIKALFLGGGGLGGVPLDSHET